MAHCLLPSGGLLLLMIAAAGILSASSGQDAVTALHPPADSGPAAMAQPHQYLCGDGLCNCTGEMARCMSVQYVPKLPPDITILLLFSPAYHMGDDFFVNVSNIRSLVFARSSLTGYYYSSSGLYSPFTNLTSLKLLCSQIGINAMEIQQALSIHTLLRLTATKCFLSSYSINEINGSNSSLEVLELPDGKFGADLYLSTFCSFGKLRQLHLNNCRLKAISYSYNDICHLNITHLSLNDNQLDRVVHLTWSSDNRIYLPHLMFLRMSGNNVTTATWSTFNKHVLPRLRTLTLDRQKPREVMVPRADGQVAVLDLPQLTALSLADNRGDFSDRRILDSTSFAVCRGLRSLILDGNDFLFVDGERFLELFGHLKELQNLSLRKCRVNSLSLGVFSHFDGLISLDVSSNGIAGIPDGVFDSLSHFRFLDMTENSVSKVTEDTFSLSMRRRLTGVYLSENPFMCDCHLLWFRGWLLTNRSLFYAQVGPEGGLSARQSYRCKNVPGMMLEEFSTVQQPCLLGREVSKQVIMTCSTILVALAVFSLLVHCRWQLRLLLYEAFRGQGQARRERLVAGRFHYDVFVSYAVEDEAWVRNHLLPRLEHERGLRLCVHERDFQPGKGIMQNVVDSVANSKKIVMLFSRDFVRSPWCQFELTYCLRYVMDYDDALVILCLDDVTSRDMTAAMMAVLKTTTYIQWQENEQAIASFWGRLNLALSEIFELNDMHV